MRTGRRAQGSPPVRRSSEAGTSPARKLSFKDARSKRPGTRSRKGGGSGEALLINVRRYGKEARDVHGDLGKRWLGGPRDRTRYFLCDRRKKGMIGKRKNGPKRGRVGLADKWKE